MPNDPTLDDHVEAEIVRCLNPSSPSSFFLYAGAGSGKTGSLVNAVLWAKTEWRHNLTLRGQKIAVITYTNAAADEISRRLDFDPLVRVSTIHAFSWELIRGFQKDIHDWVRDDLAAKIVELESKSSRAGSKKETSRLRSIQEAKEQLTGLDSVQLFTYSSTSVNRGRAALSHSQVISLTSYLLVKKPLLGRILSARNPILFIDESQDTNKTLLEAFMHVEAEQRGDFILGLFGDTMQRIYNDGKTDIAESIPDTWATPVKVMNHRSPARIVQLSNRIRSHVDTHMQEARADNGIGSVRLFIARTGSDTHRIESSVLDEMVSVTGDSEWATPIGDDASPSREPAVKRLILEHSMAAQRFGFSHLFTSLVGLQQDRTALLDGSIPGLQVFLRQVSPLIAALQRRDGFQASRIVRLGSPLLTRIALQEAATEDGALRRLLKQSQNAVNQLAALWRDDVVPTLGEVAAVLDETGLFPLTWEVKEAVEAGRSPEDGSDLSEEISAWQDCLKASFTELSQYGLYVSGQSPFATHQGVKGLEFPRVMVVISDDEAGGFLFSYEKLLGVKPPTKADIDNDLAGNDTSMERTRRLMYVTCSRATKSLAIVAYTTDPNALQAFAVENNWFAQEEIVLL